MKGRRCLCSSMSDTYDVTSLAGPKYTHHLPACLIITMKMQRKKRRRRHRRGWRLWLKEESRGRTEGRWRGIYSESCANLLDVGPLAFSLESHYCPKIWKVLHGDGKWQHIRRKCFCQHTTLRLFVYILNTQFDKRNTNTATPSDISKH